MSASRDEPREGMRNAAAVLRRVETNQHRDHSDNSEEVPQDLQESSSNIGNHSSGSSSNNTIGWHNTGGAGTKILMLTPISAPLTVGKIDNSKDKDISLPSDVDKSHTTSKRRNGVEGMDVDTLCDMDATGRRGMLNHTLTKGWEREEDGSCLTEGKNVKRGIVTQNTKKTVLTVESAQVESKMKVNKNKSNIKNYNKNKNNCENELRDDMRCSDLSLNPQNNTSNNELLFHQSNLYPRPLLQQQIFYHSNNNNPQPSSTLSTPFTPGRAPPKPPLLTTALFIPSSSADCNPNHQLNRNRSPVACDILNSPSLSVLPAHLPARARTNSRAKTTTTTTTTRTKTKTTTRTTTTTTVLIKKKAPPEPKEEEQQQVTAEPTVEEPLESESNIIHDHIHMTPNNTLNNFSHPSSLNLPSTHSSHPLNVASALSNEPRSPTGQRANIFPHMSAKYGPLSVPDTPMSLPSTNMMTTSTTTTTTTKTIPSPLASSSHPTFPIAMPTGTVSSTADSSSINNFTMNHRPVSNNDRRHSRRISTGGNGGGNAGFMLVPPPPPRPSSMKRMSGAGAGSGKAGEVDEEDNNTSEQQQHMDRLNVQYEYSTTSNSSSAANLKPSTSFNYSNPTNHLTSSATSSTSTNKICNTSSPPTQSQSQNQSPTQTQTQTQTQAPSSSNIITNAMEALRCDNDDGFTDIDTMTESDLLFDTENNSLYNHNTTTESEAGTRAPTATESDKISAHKHDIQDVIRRFSGSAPPSSIPRTIRSNNKNLVSSSLKSSVTTAHKNDNNNGNNSTMNYQIPETNNLIDRNSGKPLSQSSNVTNFRLRQIIQTQSNISSIPHLQQHEEASSVGSADVSDGGISAAPIEAKSDPDTPPGRVLLGSSTNETTATITRNEIYKERKKMSKRRYSKRHDMVLDEDNGDGEHNDEFVSIPRRRPSWSMMKQVVKSMGMSSSSSGSKKQNPIDDVDIGLDADDDIDAIDKIATNIIEQPASGNKFGTDRFTTIVSAQHKQTTEVIQRQEHKQQQSKRMAAITSLTRGQMNSSSITPPNSRNGILQQQQQQQQQQAQFQTPEKLRGMASLRHSRMLRASPAVFPSVPSTSNTTITEDATLTTMKHNLIQSEKKDRPEWSRISNADRKENSGEINNNGTTTSATVLKGRISMDLKSSTVGSRNKYGFRRHRLSVDGATNLLQQQQRQDSCDVSRQSSLTQPHGQTRRRFDSSRFNQLAAAGNMNVPAPDRIDDINQLNPSTASNYSHIHRFRRMGGRLSAPGDSTGDKAARLSAGLSSGTRSPARRISSSSPAQQQHPHQNSAQTQQDEQMQQRLHRAAVTAAAAERERLAVISKSKQAIHHESEEENNAGWAGVPMNKNQPEQSSHDDDNELMESSSAGALQQVRQKQQSAHPPGHKHTTSDVPNVEGADKRRGIQRFGRESLNLNRSSRRHTTGRQIRHSNAVTPNRHNNHTNNTISTSNMKNRRASNNRYGLGTKQQQQQLNDALTTPVTAPATKGSSSVAAAMVAGASTVKRILSFSSERKSNNSTTENEDNEEENAENNNLAVVTTGMHANRSKVTIPKPFSLTGATLQQRTRIAIEEARRRAMEVESRRRVFKAKPMPDFSKPYPPPKSSL